MFAFLEKHFEFTTSLSMEQCVLQLKAKSTRKSKLFASRREILVRISDGINGKSFVMDRDWGNNLYAEVHGHLSRNSDGSTQVSGFGRVTLFTVIFTIVFALVACFILYSSSSVFAVVGLVMLFMNLIFVVLTFNNRDNLIYIVEQILNKVTH